MMARNDIKGMKELERAFKELGKVPQTVATKSARAGASIPLKAARKNAPVDEGELKRGIILIREPKWKNGKSVYQVVMSKYLNDEYVKMSKDGKRSYYPASQEYGFLARDGSYVQGHRFMSKSLSENETAIEQKILETAGKAVEKALRG